MFAFLIQNTVLINEILRRNPDWTFSTLEDMQERIRRWPSIFNAPLLDFMKETEYYKTLYYLGSALYGEGKSAQARRFWTFLSGQGDAGEWKARAVRQLAHPEIEKPLIDSK
jgi:hypothetical protein